MTPTDRVVLLAFDAARDFKACAEPGADFISFARGYWQVALSQQPELDQSMRAGYLALAEQYRAKERR